jgi:hypothetical protein
MKIYTVEELAELTDNMIHEIEAVQECPNEIDRQSMLKSIFSEATISEGVLLATASKIIRAKFAANIYVNMEELSVHLNLLEVVGIDTSRSASEFNLDDCESLIEDFTEAAKKLRAALKGR